MLTEEQLEIYGGVLVPVFQQLEQDIIADIARRVRKEERWTETAELQAEELRRLGWSPYRIRIEVMRRLQANKEYAAMVERNTLEAKAAQQAAIDEAREALREQAPELFETVGNMAFRNDLSLWEQAGQRLTRGGAVDRAVREMRKRATGDILNLTRTMGFSLPTGSVPARRAFTAALNSALTQAVSGTVSYQQACANAVRLLTQSGLRHIDYKNGVTRQIDTAVRNAVLTASAQLSGEIMQANIEESGVAYVQVSAHWGARDSHAVWQGKVYSLAEFRSVCGYGEPSNPDHIYSYNCRHTHYPYWPGISEPVEYPPEPGPFEADGKTYTYYQATQRQRAMERSIRAMKRDALAQDAMGDKGALAAAKIRLDEKTAAYKHFSAQVNMRPRLERTQVFGYDRGAAARARSAVEKELTKAPAALQSPMPRGIISQREMANGLRKPATHILTNAEIEKILEEAESIEIPVKILSFNSGTRTGFREDIMTINIRGDILPDMTSKRPRDRMSSRAVLAHEYYGHYLNHPSEYKIGDWRDEFRASYDAADRTPNLTDEERALLMLDAYDRAKEALQMIEYDEKARRIIYGY